MRVAQKQRAACAASEATATNRRTGSLGLPVSSSSLFSVVLSSPRLPSSPCSLCSELGTLRVKSLLLAFSADFFRSSHVSCRLKGFRFTPPAWTLESLVSGRGVMIRVMMRGRVALMSMMVAMSHSCGLRGACGLDGHCEQCRNECPKYHPVNAFHSKPPTEHSAGPLNHKLRAKSRRIMFNMNKKIRLSSADLCQRLAALELDRSKCTGMACRGIAPGPMPGFVEALLSLTAMGNHGGRLAWQW